MDQPVAIVTGAGRGIGRAAAVELGRRGYRVCLAARTRSDLEETAKRVGRPALCVPMDVRDSKQVNALVQRTVGAYGRVDAIVHCAGAAPAVAVELMSDEAWREVMDTNLSSAFYLSRAAWDVFRRQGGGVVVHISSFSSRDPFAGFGAYGAAKAGLNVLSLVLAREGAEIGVRVHTIAPGAVETAMFRRLMTPEQWPREKTLEPEEVARVIGQCVCGELRHTSGEVIFIRKTV